MKQWLKDLQFTKLFKMSPKQGKIMTVIGGVLTAIIVFLIVFGDLLAPYNPNEFIDKPLLAPSMEYPLGTDVLGRDYLSRILVGARTSLVISLIAVGIMLGVGSIIGAISGFIGGSLDKVVSALMDAVWAFPYLVLAILVSAVLGPGIINTALAIGVPGIPRYYRVIRSITMGVKQRGFIEAEKVLGNSAIKILWGHIMPYYTSTLIVLSSMSVSGSILAVSGLGFIGLGIPPPSAEWGSLLAAGSGWILSGKWWLTVFPGLMIFITILAFTLLSEGLDLVFTQRERRIK